MNKCPKCEVEIQNGEKFCHNCGNQLIEENNDKIQNMNNVNDVSENNTNIVQEENVKVEEQPVIKNETKEIEKTKSNLNNKNNKNLIIIVIAVVCLVLVLITSVIVINKFNTQEETEDNIVEETETSNTDSELSENTNSEEDNSLENTNSEGDYLAEKLENTNFKEYNYLVDTLIKTYGAEELFKDGFKVSNLDSDYMLLVAIFSLTDSDYIKVDISNDSCYCEGASSKVDGYDADLVIKKAKEIFGQSIIIEKKDILANGLYKYVENSNAYFSINDSTCCGIGYYGSQIYYIINSVKDSNSKIEITLTPYEYSYVYNEKEQTGVNYVSSLDGYEVSDKSIDLENVDAKAYVEKNLDKFAKYKFVFTKENNNYILSSVNKLD